MSETAQEYSDLIVETFRERAIRTAMLIDDKFPTYAELIEKERKDLAGYETDRARIVYRTLRERNIPCDVENKASNLDSLGFEHVRKSDFILLDYHLRDETDPYDALKVLTRLADSEHFNLVVLYTAHSDLDEVWLQIAACLRGGWKAADGLLPDDSNTIEVFGNLSDSGVLKPTVQQSVSYILGMSVREFNSMVCGSVSKAGVKGPAIKQCAEAAFHEEFRRRLTGELRKLITDRTRELAGRCEVGKPRWIQCGNVFIALTRKGAGGGGQADSRDPEGIFSCLDGALKDWNPNVLQLLMSEVQNILEQQPLGYDKQILRDQATQAGWIYHVLRQASGEQRESLPLSAVLEELYGRLFTTIEDIVVSSNRLRDFGERAFRGILAGAANNGQSDQQMVGRAIELGKFAGAKPGPLDVLHALNYFLSCDDFSGRHLTTGTIFVEEQTNEWWVCATPGCDMVPEQRGDSLGWNFQMHPARPMLALRLETVDGEEALKEATQCRNLFVRFRNKALFFRAFTQFGRHPRPHMFLVKNAGRIVQDGGSEVASFEALQIARDGEATARIVSKQFVAVAQLRDSYASRLLQQTGHYTSRIGVDFVDFKKEEASVEVCRKAAGEPAPVPTSGLSGGSAATAGTGGNGYREMKPQEPLPVAIEEPKWIEGKLKDSKLLKEQETRGKDLSNTAETTRSTNT